MVWFRCFKVEDGSEVIDSVKAQLKWLPQRSILQRIYQNEEGVGQAIRESGVSREELFITSKVWNSDQGYETTLQAFETTLEKLGLEYLDLYLVHWPVKGNIPNHGKH